MRHCRLTVGAETPSTSAVSSTERPPKKRSSTIFDFCGSISARRFERVVQGDEVHVARGARGVEVLVERELLELAAALLGLVGARVIDEDAAHHLRGDAEEVRAVLPLHLRLIHEPHVRLVDERGGLQRVADALLAQVARGEAPQLAVDDGQQVVEHPAVAVRQADEQSGHLLL